MEPARLAEPARAWLAEARRSHEDGRPLLVPDRLELMPLTHGRLMDVAAEDEVGAGRRERMKNVLAARDRALVRRPPGCADEVVMENGDAERVWFRGGKARDRPLEPSAAQPTALTAERGGGVQPDDVQAGQGHRRLGRLPHALEVGPRAEQPCGGVRHVVVSRHREHGRPEPTEESRGLLELRPSPAMREIARRDDELRLDPLDEAREGRRCLEVLVRADVEVGNVEKTCRHDRTRL